MNSHFTYRPSPRAAGNMIHQTAESRRIHDISRQRHANVQVAMCNVRQEVGMAHGDLDAEFALLCGYLACEKSLPHVHAGPIESVCRRDGLKVHAWTCIERLDATLGVCVCTLNM